MISQNKTIINIAILASGTGSNALNIIEYVKESCPFLNIGLLVCDIENAQVMKKAQLKDIEVVCISLSKNKEIPFLVRKNEQEESVIMEMKSREIKWVLLAGYMKILSENFLESFRYNNLDHANIVNIHPSRLPDFPGLNAYEKAYESKQITNGATVHFVDHGMDTGPILMQSSFERSDNMSLEEFKATGLKLEHGLYRHFLQLLNKSEEDIYNLI